MSGTELNEAIALMKGFSQRTGLTSDSPSQRYLWTDAFAVCNFLGLARAMGEDRWLALARRLVDRVHHTLGRHRPDDPRRGWISGLREAEGEAHPTRGGLRIGKELPERRPDEHYDEHLEWERDGQYFHYLTKWMHALDLLSRATGQPKYNTWARALAATAHDAFSYRPAGDGGPRLYWKMSIDLSRPLVTSMGQHDALDGLVTVLQLQATAAALPQPGAGPDLERAARRFAQMLRGSELATPDPLGIGGLLMDAGRVAQLLRQEAVPDPALLDRLLEAGHAGLQHYARSPDLEAPPEYRLGFRELGLAIGLHAARRIRQAVDDRLLVLDRDARARLRSVLRFAPLGEAIESFWRRPDSQRSHTWLEHRDINEVMLATALLPGGCLDLLPAG